MNSLIVYGKPSFTFNEENVWQNFKNLSGAYNLERGQFVGARLQCEYEFNGDRTIARLSDDLQTITIAGVGDASLQLALELQQRETHPLFVTDLGYDYDIALQGLRTIDEIKRNMLVSADAAAQLSQNEVELSGRLVNGEIIFDVPAPLPVSTNTLYVGDTKIKLNLRVESISA